MDNFSIWHGLILLIVIALPVIGIATAGENRMQRKDYGYRVAVLFIVGLSLNLFVDELAIIGLPIAIAAAIFTWRWSSHRLNDIGHSPWWSLLLLVPLVNLLVLIGLVLAPGQRDMDSLAL